MADQDKQANKEALARDAQALLDNPAFERAASGLEKRLLEDLASGALKTAPEREAAYYQVRAIRLFKDELNKVLDDWKVEQKRSQRK
jgi:hypothetical protein